MSECRSDATSVAARAPDRRPGRAGGVVVATARRFASFATMGAVGTGAHYAVLVALVRFLRWEPTLGSACGCVTGMGVNYLLVRRYTFRSETPHPQTLWRFGLVASSGLVLNTLLVSTFVRRLRVHYLIAQCLTTAAVLLWNFGANARWTFAPPRAGRVDDRSAA